MHKSCSVNIFFSWSEYIIEVICLCSIARLIPMLVPVLTTLRLAYCMELARVQDGSHVQTCLGYVGLGHLIYLIA